MTNIKSLILIIPKIGVLNILLVIMHRFKSIIGYYKYKYPIQEFISKKPMFIEYNFNSKIKTELFNQEIIIDKAEKIINGSFQYFSNNHYSMGSTPNWFYDPINNEYFINNNKHWSSLDEFSKVKDIKIIWEISRFDWAITLSKALRLTGDKKYFKTLNRLIIDWQKQNPYNAGPNWKCGQETSIRLLQVLLSKYILNQHLNSESLVCITNIFKYFHIF